MLFLQENVFYFHSNYIVIVENELCTCLEPIPHLWLMVTPLFCYKSVELKI